jgi:hypothetical protein
MVLLMHHPANAMRQILVAQSNPGFIIVAMKLLGLTGGIGMGKSTAAQFLRQHGAQVVDMDELARRRRSS